MTHKHTTPLSFYYIYNALHCWKNNTPCNQKELHQALQGNKKIHEQHIELLEALEALIDGFDGEEIRFTYQDICNGLEAIKKARGE